MHRLLMTSEAYRMTASYESDASRAADPENELLWRYRPQRLDLPLHLPHPMPQRLRRATDLLGHRPDRRPLRIVPGRVLGHQPHGSFTHFRCVSSRSSHGPIIQ